MPQSLEIPKVALIGVSGYAAVYYEALLDLHTQNRIRLSAATVINAHEEPEKCRRLESEGCRIYARTETMLAEEKGSLDLCGIPTGIHWHSEMTVAALRAGCHILVEKPAAGTVAEVEAMIRARDAAERSVAVGFQHLYSEDYGAIKQRVLDGEIGRIHSIRVRGCWPRSSAYYARNNWAGKLRVGDRWVLDSPANNAFAHYLMAALHLAGPSLFEPATPTTVAAELYKTQDIETFDTICARIGTDAGAEILFAVSHASDAADEPELALHGEFGSIHWKIGESLTVARPGHPLEVQRVISAVNTQSHVFERVLNQIRGLAPEACSLEVARVHTVLINALHERVAIHSIPRNHCHEALAGSGTQHVLIGINDALRQSFDTGLLFSELKLPWALKPTTFNISESARTLSSGFTNACPAIDRATPVTSVSVGAV